MSRLDLIQTSRAAFRGASTAPDLSPLRLAWAYARHELLYICWALMDVALIAPAVFAFVRWTLFWSIPAFVAWLTLLLLLPFNLSRLMSIANVEIRRQRRISLLAFALVLLVALRQLLFEPAALLDFGWLGLLAQRALTQPGLFWRHELSLFLLLALLWWRGLSLTRRHMAVSEVGFRMRLGSLLLVPLLALLAVIPNAPPALPFVMLFFLAALVATALSRAEEVSRQQDGTPFALDARWILTIFATSLLIVLAAAAVGLALSGQGLQQARLWLKPQWDAIELGGMVVVTTTTYLLLFLLTPLQWLVRWLFALFGRLGIEGLPELEPLTPELADQNVDQLLLELGDPQSALYLWTNRAAMILLVLAALFILTVALRRYFYPREMGVADNALASPPDAAGAAGKPGQSFWRRLNRWRRWHAAATVRQLYRTMEVEAADRGFPRASAQTPYEYLPTLAEAWPNDREDAALITNAYVRARYGEIPESTQEIEALRDAWRRLAQAPLAQK